MATKKRNMVIATAVLLALAVAGWYGYGRYKTQLQQDRAQPFKQIVPVQQKVSPQTAPSCVVCCPPAPVVKEKCPEPKKAAVVKKHKKDKGLAQKPAPAPAPSADVPKAAAPVLAAKATGACTGWVLMLRAYSEQTLPHDLSLRVENLVLIASRRGDFRGEAVSRTMGEDLYYRVKPSGEATIQVQLLDPVSLKVVERLKDVRLVGGVGNIVLSDEQHRKVVETIWPEQFKSPTASHRNRAFPDEWGTNPCPPRVVSGISVP